MELINKTNLNELAKEIHENAVAHGWWDNPPTFGEIIALCHSELSEALEEFRNGKNIKDIYYSGKGVTRYDSQNYTTTIFYTSEKPRKDLPSEKPEGIAVELADCIIRILDYCAYAGIDIDKAIIEKHEFNKTRTWKHNGKRI